MKSFFKKLSLVMALAMVVTLAAPAAQAFAADLVIAEQTEAKADAKAEYSVEVDGVIDFKFYGAAAGWQDLYKWSSNNEEIAKPLVNEEGEQDGRFEALADGEVEVKLTIGEQVATVKLVVGDGVEEVTYEVIQKSDTVAEIVFTGAHNFTTSDITLSRVYDGGFTSVWPIEEIKATDNGFSIKPYVAFGDAEKYIVKVGTEDPGYEFTTIIQRPNNLVVSYKSNNQTGKAYYDDEEEYPTTFEVKYYYNNIDLTNVWKNDADVTFEVTNTNDAENLYLDEYAGELYFYKADVLVDVLAKYTYYDADNNEIVVPGAITGIRSENLPVYGIQGVVDWCIVKDGTAADKIDWNKKDIKANDDASADYKVVLLIQDSFGNKVVTDGTYATDANKYKSATDASYNFAKEGYYVTYTSSNVAKMLIGEYDATLTTYTDATVPVIIALNNSNQEYGDFVRNISAVPVKINKERTINRIEANKTVVNVTTDGGYVTESIELKVYDNYNDLWAQDVDLEVSTNIDGVTLNGASFVGGDKASYTFNGAALNGVMDGLNKNQVKVTFKANGKTEVVTVNLKDPRYDGDAIKVTGWSLDATDIDQKLKNSDNGTVVKNTITLYQLSNGLKVGKETNIKLLTTNTLTSADTAKGDRYLAVYDTENKLVTATGTGSALAVVDNGDGTFGVVVATAPASTSAMRYAAEGTYTVKVLEVSGFTTANVARFSSARYTDTFKVSNSSAQLGAIKQDKISSDATDILNVIKDTMSITLGGNAWDYSIDNIVEVKGRYNEDAGYVIITSIAFNVPLDGASDEIGYIKYVTVNKSVEVTDGFEGEVKDGKFVIE